MLIRLLIGTLVGIAFVLLSVWRSVLTLPGALLAMAMLLVILAFGGVAAAVYILAIFFLCALVHSLNKKKKNRHSDGARGVRQVACNGLIGALLLLVYGIFPHESLLVAYYAAIAEFFADTMASDIGTLFPGDPVDICRLRRIERGRSGGISLMGTLASFLGCLVCFLLSLFSEIGVLGAAVAAGAAFLGMLIDSVLGSLVQGKYRCPVCAAYTEKSVHCGAPATRIGGVAAIGNSAVNILSNIASAAIALGAWQLI